MKNRLAELAYHRRRILGEIEAQRLEVADISQSFQKPLRFVDIGINTAHLMQRHPTLVAGGLAAILTLLRKSIPGLRFLLPAPLVFALTSLFINSRSPNKQHNDFDL